MAILTKDTTKKITIDLTGPQGNAFYLLGTAMKLCKQIGLNVNAVLKDFFEFIENTQHLIGSVYNAWKSQIWGDWENVNNCYMNLEAI